MNNLHVVNLLLLIIKQHLTLTGEIISLKKYFKLKNIFISIFTDSLLLSHLYLYNELCIEIGIYLTNFLTDFLSYFLTNYLSNKYLTNYLSI